MWAMTNDPYRRLYCHFWTDENVVGLSLLAKATYIYTITGPHTTCIPGYFAVDHWKIAGSLRVSPDEAERAVVELVEAGLIQSNGSAIITKNFMLYSPTIQPTHIIGWRKVFDERMPKGDLFYVWLEKASEWFDHNRKYRKDFRAEFRDHLSTTPPATTNSTHGSPPSRERERERESKSKKVLSSVSSLPSEIQLSTESKEGLGFLVVPAARPPGQLLWEEWVLDLEKQSTECEDVIPKGMVAKFAIRSMQEFQVYYDDNTKGGRMTDAKISAFVKRVRRVPVIRMLGALEAYLDGKAGSKPWEWCAGIARSMRTQGEREFSREMSNNRRRHAETSVFAEISRELRDGE